MSKKIGDRLRDERKRRKLTQDEAAEQLRVAPNTVARWERGEMEPTGLYLDVVLRWLVLDGAPEEAR